MLIKRTRFIRVTAMQRAYVASEACDASPNFREPAVFYNKHIAAHKHLSKKKKNIYGIIRNCGNDTFHNFPLGKSSKRESLANLNVSRKVRNGFLISRYQGGNKWNYTKKGVAITTSFDCNVMPPCDWYRYLNGFLVSWRFGG